MEYFQEEKNVKEYIKIAEGYDGRELIEILKKHLRQSSSVLELGMGPGKDLDILGETLIPTGSDMSEIFVELYRLKNPDADLMMLDARTLVTDRRFDCIYSNKVLMHLSKEELFTSLALQKEILNKGGLLFHAFWKGDREEMMEGLRFVYYLPEHIKEMTKADYDVVETGTYAEMGDDDSFYIILKKK